mmetsp:Transcript_42754/g.50105  ORF Transcript_42754/g.50105 Transcript_42754/m.50105 type:complete len:96 (-) Transcript_42754:53-340(-)
MQQKSTLIPYLKLKVIVRMSYQGKTVFADKYKVRPASYAISSSNMYQLYIRYVYLSKLMTNEQFIDVFPTITEEKMGKWIVSYENDLRYKAKSKK